jgi:hypothetical protein
MIAAAREQPNQHAGQKDDIHSRFQKLCLTSSKGKATEDKQGNRIRYSVPNAAMQHGRERYPRQATNTSG